MKPKFILLDRDGVINYDSHEYIKSPDEWLPIPGSLEAIARLNQAELQVIIVTNQSGIGRGLFNLDTLKQIHAKLERSLAAVGGHVDEIYFCPHHPKDQCQCRKPKPGLLQKIKAKYNMNFEDTFYVGDSLIDMQVANSVGCKPILVLTGNGKKTLKENPGIPSIPYFSDLAGAVAYILKQNKVAGMS